MTTDQKSKTQALDIQASLIETVAHSRMRRDKEMGTCESVYYGHTAYRYAAASSLVTREIVKGSVLESQYLDYFKSYRGEDCEEEWQPMEASMMETGYGGIRLEDFVYQDEWLYPMKLIDMIERDCQMGIGVVERSDGSRGEVFMMYLKKVDKALVKEETAAAEALPQSIKDLIDPEIEESFRMIELGQIREHGIAWITRKVSWGTKGISVYARDRIDNRRKAQGLPPILPPLWVAY